jgi:hypothetical protein
MKKCVCGAEYRHGSSLSRHQRGIASQGVAPCSVLAERLAKEFIDARKVELGEHILSTLKVILETKNENTSQVPLEDFDPNNPPTWVLAQSSVLDEVFVGTFNPSKVLEVLYCNKEHPESWSVTWPNLKSERVAIWKEGKWVHKDFESWSWDFIVFCILNFHKNSPTKIGELYIHLKSSEGKELRSHQKRMRDVLWKFRKRQHLRTTPCHG